MPVTTLTLHHINPYVPFKLEVQSGGSVIRTLVMCPQLNLTTINVHSLITGIGHKPLLYSLDECFDLASPFIMNNTDWDITIAEEVSDFANYKKSLLQCSYAAIQAMAEAHIDFQRLIDAGIAVKKEPLK